MAYIMTFSNTKLADSFFESALWLNRAEQNGINVMAVTTELELPEDGSGMPDMHHLSLVYSDGNEPAAAADLAAYREEHGRQL